MFLWSRKTSSLSRTSPNTFFGLFYLKTKYVEASNFPPKPWTNSSLLRSLHCPVLENEWGSGERTVSDSDACSLNIYMYAIMISVINDRMCLNTCTI